MQKSVGKKCKNPFHRSMQYWRLKLAIFSTLLAVVIYTFKGKKINFTLICITDATGSIGSNFDNQTLERWIKQIKQDLLIDKRNTNAYMRTLISVYDPRPASIAIGGSGVVLLCIATFIFVLPDVLTFCKHVFDKISKATKSETGSQWTIFV